MQIIGSTGEGKSKFIESMIRQDILNNNGLCLIDPHGHLYHDIVTWCAHKGMLDRRRPKKIILFDPSDNEWTFGFNPLRVSSADIALHVDRMINAVAAVWGGEDTTKTPLLKRCLRIVFHALAEKQLSLLEAPYLIDPARDLIRKYLTRDIKDPNIKQQWEIFNSYKPYQFDEKVGSTANRMMEFLASDIIRLIIGQTEQTIDFRNIMDEGYVLLANLSASDKISDDNARLLGALIVNDLFMKAKGRERDSRPFYLYIDECGLFMNNDIARILDEARKFGLHLILAHQHLAQLKKAGEDVYHSVMTDAKTKVIFGGLSAEDAEVLAKQIFLGEIDLEEAKTSLNKPTVVRQIKVWLKNYTDGKSVSKGESESETESEGEVTTRSDGQSHTSGITRKIALGPDGQPMFMHSDSDGTSGAESTGTTRSRSRSLSRSTQETESRTDGASETYVSEYEDRPTTVFSYTEQLYRKMAVMVNQPTQHAILKLPKQTSKIIKTPTVNSAYTAEERLKKFKLACYDVTDYARLKPDVVKMLSDRHANLELKAIEYQQKDDEDPESFRE